MTGTAYIPPRQTPVNSSGRPYAGALAYFYVAGTTTDRPVYTSSALNVTHTQPVVANSAGLFPAIYLDPQYTYRCILKTSAGVTLRDDDDIPGSAITSAQVGQALYPRTSAEITAGVTPTYYHYEPGDVRRYGADPEGANDSTTAFNNACLSNNRVIIGSRSSSRSTPRRRCCLKSWGPAIRPAQRTSPKSST
jgi:hypothetical protein